MIDFSLNELYAVAGISKQAVHQSRQRQRHFAAALEELIVEMDELRDQHPGCGLEKAYYTLQPSFLGRDRFVETFKILGYHVRKKRAFPRTTCVGTRRFPDLIEGRTFIAPNQVWQSDITYFDLGDRFAYIVFIIDIYSKVVVGHQVSDHLRKEANIKALRDAIDRYGAPAIHHSDRGSQYSSHAYLGLLEQYEAQVSMAATGPRNAYAERINLTIKDEFLDHWEILNLAALVRSVNRAVKYYNHHRIHNHLHRMTPLEFLKAFPNMEQKRRPIVKIPILNS